MCWPTLRKFNHGKDVYLNIGFHAPKPSADDSRNNPNLSSFWIIMIYLFPENSCKESRKSKNPNITLPYCLFYHQRSKIIISSCLACCDHRNLRKIQKTKRNNLCERITYMFNVSFWSNGTTCKDSSLECITWDFASYVSKYSYSVCVCVCVCVHLYMHTCMHACIHR
jgi:hypothetical protein